MKNFLIPQFKMYSKSFVYILLIALSAFALSSCEANEPEKIQVLMVGGGTSHDYDQWYKGVDSETLESEGIAEVRYTDNTDSIGFYLPESDVLYLSNNQPIKNPEVRQAIFDFVEAGNGLVLGHAALWYNWADWPEYNQQLVSGGSRGHDPYGNFTVTVENTTHPITEGVEEQFSLDDELYYYKVDTTGPGIEVLATGSAPGSEENFPSVFVINNSEGRIVGLALGHDEKAHQHPAYQTLLRNAVEWAAGN